MAQIGKQKETPSNASISVSLREVYECLCPKCRKAMIDLLCGKAEGVGIRGILLRRLEGKPDGS